MTRDALQMRGALRADFRAIVDCMTGADGGAEFVRLRVMLESLDAMAANGDKSAAECVAVVTRFAQLIEAAQRPERMAKRPELDL